MTNPQPLLADGETIEAIERTRVHLNEHLQKPLTSIETLKWLILGHPLVAVPAMTLVAS